MALFSSRAISRSARRGVLLLAALASWIGAPAEVQSQRGEAVSSEGSGAYRALIEEALREFDHGNWEEAGALFARAHAMEPNARTLRGMGLAAYEGRHYVESLQHLRAALADARRPLTASQRSDVERTIERAERYVGRVEFVLDPRSAEVKVNGRLAVLDDGVLIADAGTLDIEISAPGYLGVVRRIRVAPGATERVEVRLAGSDTAAAGPTTPNGSTPSPPPRHTDEGSGLGTWKWVTGGTAIAAAGLGVAGVVLSNSAADEWNACRDVTEPELRAGQRPGADVEGRGDHRVRRGRRARRAQHRALGARRRSESDSGAASACSPVRSSSGSSATCGSRTRLKTFTEGLLRCPSARSRGG